MPDTIDSPALPQRTSLARHAVRALAARLRSPWAVGASLLGVALAGAIVYSAVAPVSIPRVNLAADPLYAAASGDKATMALALSVEFPTVGAQYVGVANSADDATYANTNEYLGYYDAESCYSYNNAPTETPPAGMTAGDLKRFDRIGTATNRMCADGFSGNFLNWASNSAIDMLRLALSGGDRYIDTTDLTILQRAIVPNGDPTCMWNSTNFPAKRLARNGGGGAGATAFWGAVPAAMATAAGSNDIYVANTLNRIYFSTSRGGTCNNTSGYNLAGPVATIGPVVNRNETLPLEMLLSRCATEGNVCSFTGVREVWYGAGTRWAVAPASGGVNCTNAVFGDPISGTAKACYIRASTWTPPTSASVLNSDGFFYARVQVCNVNASGVLQDVRNYGSDITLCRQYPSGRYKPGGAIQKYADQIRLAAFGYALEQTASYDNGRYGGVLRAPMKYVGGKTFDENGIENTVLGGNPGREWDLTTGVFFANPDNDTTQTPRISGVINYLNKFGRTGPVPGRYKRYDPVGELHYEALRYLQGLQPTAAAVANLTTEMYDGFPLFTTWTDPYGGNRTNDSDYSCLKSNIVVIGDINTHDGNRLPNPNPAQNVPDIAYWRGVVQAFERNSRVDYPDGQNVTRTTGNPNGSNGSVPGGTQTSQIMGTAYWANTHDIRGTDWNARATLQRPGLRVKTFVFDVNENGTQSNAATRRSSNQFFMAAKYGGFTTKQPTGGGQVFNTKGNPFQQEDGTNNNDVWQKPADPGEASTYYLQSSARGVLNAFEDIFSRSTSDARSIGGASASTRELVVQDNNLIYQGSFDTADWSGDVVATAASTAGGTVSLGDRVVWSASDMLLSRAAPASTRNIFVGGSGTNPRPAAVPFLWDSIGSTMQGHLNKPDTAAVADGQGAKRLNYLRGDRTEEAAIAPATSPLFRPRSKLLGDIVNSGVAYAGRLSPNLGAQGYAAFAKASASRTAAVYVGANDGMLHAFDAATGAELFAYIPSWVVPNLSILTSRTYPANHRSYVDAPPVVGPADLGAAGSPDWRTVLVSGTGGGGKGVFALDVTNPSTFAAGNALWEFTDAHDVDMGFVVGRPQILRLRTGGGSSPTYKWFAVVASGVNNYIGAVGGVYSDGNPSLFLLDLSKPAGTAWVRGTNYYKITVPLDTTLALTNPAGLLSFKAEFGTADEVTRIYMGDLHGKVWRLDFNADTITSPADWTMAKLSPLRSAAGTPLPLFMARDSANRVQPITMAPTIAFSGNSNANYVIFGTGKYLEIADKTAAGTQSFYALYDDIRPGSQTPDTAGATAALISGRNRLRAGTVDTATRAVTVPSFRWGRRTDALVSASSNVYSGWYFDFPDPGERQVFNIAVNGDLLVFNTLFPESTTANVCGSAGGNSNSYALNMDTGTGGFIRSTVGVLGEPMVLPILSQELNRNDPSKSGSDATGRRIRRVTAVAVSPGSKGLAVGDPVAQDIIIGRLSWRRINNYQELKQAPW